MSELTTSHATAMADALQALGGPAGGNLIYSPAEILARISTLLGAGVSHLTTSIPNIVAGIRNQIIGGAARSARTTSQSDLLAEISGVSALTHSSGGLWGLALSAIAGASAGGGGSDGASPSLDFSSADNSQYIPIL